MKLCINLIMIKPSFQKAAAADVTERRERVVNYKEAFDVHNLETDEEGPTELGNILHSPPEVKL